MIGVLVLILRILLAAALYLFLGWAIYILWRDLSRQSTLLGEKRIPCLQLTWQDGQVEQTREFTNPQIIVGRDPTCDCPIPEDTVSARHARLSYHHNQWWLEDMNSTNGTFLNQERLDVPTIVVTGDEFRCGQVDLTVTIREKQNKEKHRYGL